MDKISARTLFLVAGLALASAAVLWGSLAWESAKPAWPELGALAAFSLLSTAAGLFRKTPSYAAIWTLSLPLTVLAMTFVGAAGLAGTALVLAGGLALGTLFGTSAHSDPWPRWIAGIGLLAACAGWTLPLPIHQQGIWGVALLALATWRRRQMAEDFRAVLRDARSAAQAAPRVAILASIVVVVASAPAWLPMRNADDLALRLGLANELLSLGHGRLDIGSQVWAMAPWSTDMLHALASLLSGKITTGPLNLFWLIASFALIRRLSLALGSGHAAAFWAGILFCSLPMTSGLTGSLQVESATPAILAALALVIQNRGNDRRDSLLTIAALAGFLLGAKASNALYLLPMGIWWIARSWPHIAWKWLPAGLGIGVIAGGSSYAYAAWLSGNPVLPILNGMFQSEWFAPRNFVDSTWQTGLTWNVAWRIVTDTSTYFEGGDGSAGLVLLALSASLLLATIEPRTRGLALTGAASLLLVLWQVQYLRYFHPAFALLIPAAMAVSAPMTDRLGWRHWAFAALCCAQLALIPTVSWMFSQGAFRLMATEGSDGVLRRFVPERLIIERQRTQLGPADRVLYTAASRGHVADLPLHAIPANWHSPKLSQAKDGITDPVKRWEATVERAGANLLMVHNLPASPDLNSYLRDAGATRIDGEGTAQLFKLPANRPAIEVLRSDEGRLTAKIPMEGDHRRRYLGEAKVTMHCDAPGEPIAIGWTLSSPAGQLAGQWAWLTCGPSGEATSAIQFASTPADATLVFSAGPARADSQMTVLAAAADADVRQDFKAEGEQYRRARQALCLGRCSPTTVVLKTRQ